MAGYDAEKDYSWIEKVRSGGAVPYLEPENCSNGWATPTSDNFMVRGPNYLSDKIKIHGGEYLLEPLGFDWIKGPAKISEILRNTNHRVRRAIDDEIARGNRPFVWAFNLQLPTKDNYSAVMYFVALEPIQDGTLMDKFLKGDDSFRNSRLKLIANIVQGPWIVRTAVGEQAICILGRALSCKYTSGLNYIEVDVDIGSSIIANAIVHLAFSYISTLTVDLAFLIESQTEEELPEQILGSVRFSNLNPASAGLCDLTSDVDAGSLPPLLPTRLWRSIGFGFTSQPSQGSLEPHANGNLHGEDDANKDENCAIGLMATHLVCRRSLEEGLYVAEDRGSSSPVSRATWLLEMLLTSPLSRIKMFQMGRVLCRGDVFAKRCSSTCLFQSRCNKGSRRRHHRLQRMFCKCRRRF